MFPKDSAFGQDEARISRALEAVDKLSPLEKSKAERKDTPPFKHWHHQLVTVDVLLDQRPPEVERARELILEIADDIHSQFERTR